MDNSIKEVVNNGMGVIKPSGDISDSHSPACGSDKKKEIRGIEITVFLYRDPALRPDIPGQDMCPADPGSHLRAGFRVFEDALRTISPGKGEPVMKPELTAIHGFVPNPDPGFDIRANPLPPGIWPGYVDGHRGGGCILPPAADLIDR